MNASFGSYILLIKSRVNRGNIAPISFSLNTVIALIAASILTGIDWLTFGKNLVLSVISMLATAISVYIYNDLTDIKIDRINKLYRPLVTGKASQKDAKTLIALLGIIGLTTSFIINFKVFLLMLTYYALFFLYSFPPVRLKSKFLVNKITVATGTAIAFLIGSVTTGTIPTPIVLISGYSFVAALTTSMVIDLRDIEGDKKYNVQTFPIVWGPILTIRLAIALICSVGLGTLIGYYRLGFNNAFLILAFCAFSAWIYVLIPLFRYWNDPFYVETIVIKKIAPIGFLLQILTVLGAVFTIF